MKIIRMGMAAFAAAAVGGLGASALQAPAPAESGLEVATDVVIAADGRELVRSSSLIVVGTPVGEPSAQVLESGDSADYFQSVAVESTLKGRSADSVTVVRNGLTTGVEAEADHQVAGPLAAGRQVFFLQPGGTPGSYAIVGHFQGDVDFSTGRVAGSDLPELNGKDQAQLSAFVAATPDQAEDHH